MTSTSSTKRLRIPAVATALAVLAMLAIVSGCDLLIPGVPRALTATAGDRSVDLTWSAPTPNRSPAPTGYVIGYDNREIVFDRTGDEFTFTATGLTNGRSYTFWIRAFNGNGRGPAMESGPVWPNPAGLAFYTPPSPLPSGAPGDIIWARPLTGTHALPYATNTLVLYHSTSVPDGSDEAESGMVSIPLGQPPEGGWPVIAYAPEDTGLADSCAWSLQDTASAGDPTLAQWVERGFVVVRTDYEGLGTPGPYPNAIGESMARSVIDSVRAARNLDARVGNRWVAMGHSRGGQGIFFTGDAAARRAPELVLVGTVAMAPYTAFAARLRIWTAYPDVPLIDGNFAMELYGAAAAYPDVRPDLLLTPSALALYAQVDQVCQPAVVAAWSGRRSVDTFQPLADLQPLLAAFDANEPGTLHLGNLPILIAQGLSDFGTIPSTTNTLVQALQTNGATNITYLTYPGTDHLGVVAASLPDVEQWVDAQLAEHPA